MTALSTFPPACLAPAASETIARDVRLGEMVFNSPALLGRQAEKMGLSCGSCHRNGRGNRDFQFEAISGAPGTADVTSGLFSADRADNQFNPVPIPDLATKDGRDQVDRTDRAALAVFVRGQIEEEFSGDRPADEVFEPLLTYLQAIDGRVEGCFSAEPVKVGWRRDWAEAQFAGRQIGMAGSENAAAFYRRTARLALGRIYARYNGVGQDDIRAGLIDLSRAIEAGAVWPDKTASLEAGMAAAESVSLYNPDTLGAALDLAAREK